MWWRAVGRPALFWSKCAFRCNPVRQVCTASTFSPALQQKLQRLATQYNALAKDAVGNVDAESMRTQGFQRSVAQLYGKRTQCLSEKNDLQEMAECEADADLAKLAQEDLQRVLVHIAEVEAEIQELIRDRLQEEGSEDTRTVVLQVKPAAGGSEAGLFATELFRMYESYCERRPPPLPLFHATSSSPLPHTPAERNTLLLWLCHLWQIKWSWDG